MRTCSSADHGAGAPKCTLTCHQAKKWDKPHSSRPHARGGRLCPVHEWPVLICPLRRTLYKRLYARLAEVRRKIIEHARVTGRENRIVESNIE